MKITKQIISISKDLYNNFNICLSEFIKDYALKCRYLNFKFRISKIDTITLLEIKDHEIYKYNLGRDFEDLVFKIFINIQNSKINIYLLSKFLFLLNFSSKRDIYLRFAERLITKFNFDFNKLPNLFPFIIAPFVTCGDYKTADKLIIIIREKKDKFFNRHPVLNKERSYLTYIGHLSLFVYYLKSREISFLGEDDSSFLFNKYKVSNNLFFKLIKDRAASLDVSVKETEKKYNYHNNEDHEMELWPCKSEKKYFLARQLHGIVEEKWNDQYQRDSFFNISENIFNEAKEIMISNNILQSKKWFIGIHLRTSHDKRTLRNACFENINYICEQIIERGGEVVFTGTKNFMDLKSKANIYFIDELNISKPANELLQLYIWSKASFFVGNLSGGTHPPGLFGTPTIWLDVHPTVHARPPSKFDTVIPKKVFDIRNNKFLTFKEANSDQHFRCQTESKFLANYSGYEIFPSDLKIIEKVTNYYISKFVFNKEMVNDKFFNDDEFSPQEKGARYKFKN